MSGLRASRTAVLMCQSRAVADGRVAVGRFADPIAMRLLNDDEQALVRLVRQNSPPTEASQRLEYRLLVGSAEVAVPRTVAIDDALRARLNPQVVILGAGLDTRAFRMSELATVDVFEVDQPASQQDKRSRVAELGAVARSLRFVPVDFARDPLRSALEAAGFDPNVPTTWIWEGVVAYLRPADVAATVDAVVACSAAGSRLIVNYQAPSVMAALGRALLLAVARLSGQQTPISGEPRRSAWTPLAMARLLTARGMRVVSDEDQAAIAARLDLAVHHVGGSRLGRIAVADNSA